MKQLDTSNYAALIVATDSDLLKLIVVRGVCVIEPVTCSCDSKGFFYWMHSVQMRHEDWIWAYAFCCVDVSIFIPSDRDTLHCTELTQNLFLHILGLECH